MVTFTPAHRLGRRGLARVAAGTFLSSVWGCGFAPEEGPAFEPWDFPGDERRPELVAVRAAVLAASPHNTQPWRFEVDERWVDVFVDDERSLGPMDPSGRERRIGVGCAIENLAIAARHFGRSVEVELLPEPGSPSWLARIGLSPSDPQPEALFESIAKRRTHRGPYLDGPVDGLADALAALVEEPEVSFLAIEGEAERTAFREATLAATRAIAADTEMSEASHAWYRHTREEIDLHRDGTTLDASGQSATIRALGKSQPRPDAATAAAYWVDATRDRQGGAAMFCALSTKARTDTRALLQVGRVYQRMHLYATSVGLAMQPQNQLAEMRDREIEGGSDNIFGRRLAYIIDSTARHGQMLFRVGYAFDEAFESPRRGAHEVTI